MATPRTAYCCWPAQNEAVLTELDDYDVHHLLKSGQTELRVLLFVHLPILMLWSVATWARGFGNLYDGTGFNAVSHVWFYLAWETLIVAWGYATGFEFWVTRDGRLQKDSASIRWKLKWWFFFLGVGLAAHIVHVVATAYELNRCDSTLCMQNKGVMYALIAGLAVLFLLEVIEIVRGATFHWHLFHIAKLKPHIFNEQYMAQQPTKIMPSALEANEENDVVVQVTPSAPPGNGKGQVLYKIPLPAYKPKRSLHGLRKNRSE